MAKGKKREIVISLADFNVDDKETFFTHLGFRCVYTFICLVILGFKVEPSTNFFITLIFFGVPLLVDYLKFGPDYNKPGKITIRKTIRTVGIILSVLWVILGCVGTWGPIELIEYSEITQNTSSTEQNVQTDNIDSKYLKVQISKDFIVLKEKGLPLSFIWCLIGVSAFLTFFDIWVFKNAAEQKIVETLRREIAIN